MSDITVFVLQLIFWLSISATILHVAAYALYNLQTRRGQSAPNVASWGIWVFLAAMNAATYRVMSGNTVATLQFFVGTACCFGTFLYTLFAGKFEIPDPKKSPLEYIVLALGIISGLVWWYFRSAACGSIILCIAFAISTVPTWKGVWLDPSKETPAAWILWTLAFLCSTCAAILRQGGWVPVLVTFSFMAEHLIVAILSRPARKERFRQQTMTIRGQTSR